ncbi:MAG TPA: hypothetical protein VH280_08485 [Verrucomicrobiae bacterium]|jgi:hypothetical protein|nr:hypothetical protein [Verrucomicrobiae bacterium]
MNTSSLAVLNCRAEASKRRRESDEARSSFQRFNLVTFQRSLSRSARATLTALALALSTLNNAFAQGTLTPPGPPGATMLTLSQIQPRAPISVPAIITKSGSYYLTTNITVGSGNVIVIATNNVMLDLNGFTISSMAAGASGSGILFNSDLRNVTIANGFIQGGVTNNGSNIYGGSGFAYGIYFSGNSPVNVLVSHVSIAGCLYSGIYLNSANSTVVESCTATTVGSYGIFASTIKQSSAMDCGGTAIYANVVSDCQGQSSSFGEGIIGNYVVANSFGYCAGSGAGIIAQTAQTCYGECNGSGDGITATDAQNCYGYSNTGVGIQSSMALNCYGYSGESDGLDAQGNAQNCFGFSDGGGYGVYCGYIANDCYGYSYTYIGLDAFIANVCHGATGTGTAFAVTHNINSF